MIFRQIQDGGISQPVNLASVEMCGLDEPRESLLIFLTGYLLGDYSSEGYIWIVLAHLDEVFLPSVLMPYGDRFLSRQGFEFLPEPFHFLQSYD